jgi:NAD(P)-dependent dehydrogenase (short-subunit alcohol dehydrogenase family)
MDIKFNDKVVLVTGGSEGIGEATSIAFGKHGAKVGVLGRDREKVRSVVNQIKHEGGEACGLVADVGKVRSIQQAIEKLFATYGRLDIVFANAGMNGVWAPIEELKPTEWEETITTNLTGTFLTLKYAVPYLKKSKGSVVINASVNGTRMFSNTGASAYASTKAAQVAFAKMLALELAPSKVRVNVICPGAIDTSINEKTTHRHIEKIAPKVEFPKGTVPLTKGEPGTSQQVADLVLFLSSEYASHISGTEVWIDGAQSLLQG